MKKISKKFALFCALLAIFLIAVDLATKTFFTNKSFVVLQGIFSIHFCTNTGAAWSFFSNHTTLLTVFSAVAILGLTVAFFKFEGKTRFFVLLSSIVLAGAVGNLVDRILFSHVRDFLKIDFFDFPIFNVADCCLTVGIFLLVVWILKTDFGKIEKLSNKHENLSSQNKVIGQEVKCEKNC